MLHELWVDADGLDLYCLAGPQGDRARELLKQPAELVWTAEAESHFAAMTMYYEYRHLGVYRTDYPEFDHQPYADRGQG